ncbi:NAD-dependent epimerase/dehydratase family protein [Kiloniella antarctica]|uniref:NAD-dependent epimerase/dehydratase family protein n=1 Tax=Kiloniella antarctica TaxID=1550907 RepID=A0ABW5BMY3_9PROT
MSRILVTGGSGFIGRHAVVALEKSGHDVVLLSRSGSSSPSGYDYVVGDLLKVGDPERIAKDAGADLLLHLAWETEHGHFWNAESNHLWREQTISLVSAFWKEGGQRAVCAGSCAEYDWNNLSSTDDLDEYNSPQNPETLYGQSKLDCFKALTLKSDHEKSFAWGRVFLLYGAGETPTRFVPSIVCSLLSDKEARMSSGTQVRDFMDSRDVGRAFASLLLSGVEGAVNIGSGHGYKLLDVAKLIAKKLEKEELLKPGTYPDRENEPSRLVGTVTRLKEEVGFQGDYTLDEGLTDCLKYWQGKTG